ncbi:MAG: response regulator [Chloroflexi bacterium]|jgi:two-component system response regulator|nr:MAG: response regulator [Chloroflexota bacterium]
MNQDEIVEILLVEDNLRDAELTLRALKRNNLANRVVHTEDGAEALDFLFARGKYEGRHTEAAPKVILLDLKLPKVNGLEVLRIIKSDPRLLTIPVVIVTSSAEDPDMEAAYKLGANSYVIKPVQFDAFMEAMSKLGMYWLMVNHALK